MMLLFLLASGAPVPALMRFSAPVKKHWLGSFSIVLPPSGLRGFFAVVRDRWEQGRHGGPGAKGREGGGGIPWEGGGGRGKGTREHIYIYIHVYQVCVSLYSCQYAGLDFANPEIQHPQAS